MLDLQLFFEGAHELALDVLSGLTLDLLDHLLLFDCVELAHGGLALRGTVAGLILLDLLCDSLVDAVKISSDGLDGCLLFSSSAGCNRVLSGARIARGFWG